MRSASTARQRKIAPTFVLLGEHDLRPPGFEYARGVDSGGIFRLLIFNFVADFFLWQR